MIKLILYADLVKKFDKPCYTKLIYLSFELRVLFCSYNFELLVKIDNYYECIRFFLNVDIKQHEHILIKQICINHDTCIMIVLIINHFDARLLNAAL